MIDQLPATLQALMTWKTVPAGQIVFHAGEKADLLFFLESGRVRLLQYAQTGEEINHYPVEPGEFFAEVVLFLDTYACSAIADQVSQIVAIPTTAFLDELRQNAPLATLIMSQMARRLHTTKILVDLKSIRSARERVLRYFQIMIPLMGNPQQSYLDLDRPHHAIAADLGISPETFSRSLKQLQEAGALNRENRRIILHER